MIQAVLLFLLLIMILGIGGKWLRLPPKRRPDAALEQATRCRVCRNFVVGRAPAACDRSDCPHR